MGGEQDSDVCAAKGRGMLLRENAAGGTGRAGGIFGGRIVEMEKGPMMQQMQQPKRPGN